MILTKDSNGNEVVKLFDDGIVIDQKLPKWEHAEKYLKEKKEKEKKDDGGGTAQPMHYRVINESTETNAYTGGTGSWNVPQTFIVYNSSDPYVLRGDVKFDEIASASLLELTALIKSKEINNILAGYGGMHGFSSNTVPILATEDEIKKTDNFFKRTFLKAKLAYLRTTNKDFEFDVVKFFELVKLTSKESKETYRDRVASYLKAIHNAKAIGQTALLENLVKELIANKFESELYAHGNYYAISEEQLINFSKKVTTKDVCLTYIKNFTRPIPEDVVEKLVEANKLEVFDNYVIMHYDPKKKAVKPTEKEIAKETIKKRDPILFGVISGSRKLYYIADWIDEYCDLTLEKFVETLDIDKKDLLLKGPKDEVKTEEPAASEDKPKKKTSTKKKTSKKKEE